MSSKPLVFGLIVILAIAVVAVASLSRPSVVASQLSYNVSLKLNGIEVSGWTPDRCPATSENGTGPWVCSIIANGVVENNSRVFLTGQVVQVNLWFEYLKKPADPATITLDSVQTGSGFQVVKMDGSLPQQLSGWGYQAGVVLYLKVLPGEHSAVDMSAQFSA